MIEAVKQQMVAQGEALPKQMSIQGDLLLRVVDGLRAGVRLELSPMRSELRLEMRESIAPLGERVAVFEERSRGALVSKLEKAAIVVAAFSSL